MCRNIARRSTIVLLCLSRLPDDTLALWVHIGRALGAVESFCKLLRVLESSDHPEAQNHNAMSRSSRARQTDKRTRSRERGQETHKHQYLQTLKLIQTQ